MTLEQVWGVYKMLSAPTPAVVVTAKRVYGDTRAACGLINEILPDTPEQREDKLARELELEDPT